MDAEAVRQLRMGLGFCIVLSDLLLCCFVALSAGLYRIVWIVLAGLYHWIVLDGLARLDRLIGLDRIGWMRTKYEAKKAVEFAAAEEESKFMAAEAAGEGGKSYEGESAGYVV